MPDIDLDVPSQPKVFISYSWSTPRHQQQVREWAERLIADGVDVVLDVFDLKEGHDKYHFMERMVVDPAITHVLVVSDQQYADKADRRASGVGTESQIISSEIYGQVSQSKFVPIVCEFSAGGDPHLPVFMQSLIWIDFSSAEAVNQNWERLVRLLHGKPAYKKPRLGLAPAYLAESPSSPASPLVGKLASLRQALISNPRIAGGARQDFVNACLNFAEPYRIEQDPQLEGEGLIPRLLKDSEELKVLRNSIVDWTLLESSHENNAQFSEQLLPFLEQLLEIRSPQNLSRWSEVWFEALKVFVYETFLYIVAALLKNKAYELLSEVLSTSYMLPRSDRRGGTDFGNLGQFYHASNVFQSAFAPPNTRLFSPIAELVKRQADRTDLPLNCVIEADLLVFLKAITSKGVRWYPQMLFYASNSEFPFLIRAAQKRNFKHLATIIGIPDSGSLKVQAQQGYEDSNVSQVPDFFLSPRSPWESLRIDAYDTV